MIERKYTVIKHSISEDLNLDVFFFFERDGLYLYSTNKLDENIQNISFVHEVYCDQLKIANAGHAA